MSWYTLENAAEIPSPALVVYPDRVRENLRRMIALAGGTERLRPHIKTHKMAEVVRLKLDAGVRRFKCSTIAEAELLANCSAADVMLAYPQVGPNARRFARLAAANRGVAWSTIADDAGLIRALDDACRAEGVTIEVALDIDGGMHRSGIAPELAAELYGLLADCHSVRPGGLHLYDGQCRDRDIARRAEQVTEAFAPVEALWRELLSRGWPVPRVTCGGTPSFPVHARRRDVECSPGTCVFWDINYSTKFPDLSFEYAAMLLVRVVSKPGGNRLCLDAGYKAVSPDNAELRIVFPDADDARVVNHSEEHLAIETARAGDYAVGDVLYGVPFHVCPTVAMHREAWVARDGFAAERWQVAARDRRLTF